MTANEKDTKDNIPRRGMITAICRTNHDPWTGKEIPQLEIGKTYNVDYVIIGSSWTMVCLSEYPEQFVNSVLFSFFIDGELFSLTRDYQALRRVYKDTYKATTLVIYNVLSENRLKQIKQKHNNVRIIIRSDIFNYMSM